MMSVHTAEVTDEAKLTIPEGREPYVFFIHLLLLSTPLLVSCTDW